MSGNNEGKWLGLIVLALSVFAIIVLAVLDRIGTEASLRDYFSGKDSLAQWLMAAFSVVATAVSVWAVRLLRETLKATREAVRSTDAAIQASQEIGQIQLRSYVWVHSTELSGFAAGQIPNVKVGVKNYGQTPAFITSHHGFIHFSGFPLAGPLPYLNVPITSATPLGPGREDFVSLNLGAPLLQGDINRLAVGNSVLHVYGRLRYKDIYGKDFEITYRLKTGGDAGFNPNELFWCEDGNTASYFDFEEAKRL